jgi:hypothetical protein
MQAHTFYRKDEKKGYPFFNLSAFKAWIVYKDGNKRCRLSIETSTTVHQLLSGRIVELKLDRQIGYNLLIQMCERHAPYIQKCIIYSVASNKIYREMGVNGTWTIINDPDFIGNNPIKNINFTKDLNNNTIICYV